MELDLKNFERDRTDENLEWWMFEFDHSDFFIALNKESLLKILNWEELKSELYWHWNWIDIRKLDKWVKKELTFCLLSDTERTENFTEALPIWNHKDSEKVTIKISEDLLDKISKYKWGFWYEAYEYRYDARWNKMHFYVNDSFWKEQLKNNIDFTIFRRKSKYGMGEKSEYG